MRIELSDILNFLEDSFIVRWSAPSGMGYFYQFQKGGFEIRKVPEPQYAAGSIIVRVRYGTAKCALNQDDGVSEEMVRLNPEHELFDSFDRFMQRLEERAEEFGTGLQEILKEQLMQSYLHFVNSQLDLPTPANKFVYEQCIKALMKTPVQGWTMECADGRTSFEYPFPYKGKAYVEVDSLGPKNKGIVHPGDSIRVMMLTEPYQPPLGHGGSERLSVFDERFAAEENPVKYALGLNLVERLLKEANKYDTARKAETIADFMKGFKKLIEPEVERS